MILFVPKCNTLLNCQLCFHVENSWKKGRHKKLGKFIVHSVLWIFFSHLHFSFCLQYKLNNTKNNNNKIKINDEEKLNNRP